MLKAFLNKLFNKEESQTIKAKPKNEGALKEGTVKFFKVNKGFGFINVKDTNEDIFVHSSNLIDKIRKGDQVQFTIEPGEKGPTAVNVKLLQKT